MEYPSRGARPWAPRPPGRRNTRRRGSCTWVGAFIERSTGSVAAAFCGPRRTALLANGQVLEVCNVSDPGVPPCAAELYTPASGTWSEDGPADPSAEAGYGKVLLNTGDVLFSGGADTFGSDSNRRIVVQSDATLFDPITGADSSTGSMSIPQRRSDQHDSGPASPRPRTRMTIAPDEPPLHPHPTTPFAGSASMRRWDMARRTSSGLARREKIRAQRPRTDFKESFERCADGAWRGLEGTVEPYSGA